MTDLFLFVLVYFALPRSEELISCFWLRNHLWKGKCNLWEVFIIKVKVVASLFKFNAGILGLVTLFSS